MMSRWKRGLLYLLGLTVAGLFTLPFFWAVVSSLRQPGLPPSSTIEWWPQSPHWENYVDIFRLLPMHRYIVNSLIVVAAAVPLTWLTATAAGFAMSQLADPWRRRLFVLSVVLLMIPAMAVWVFRFRLLAWLGLLDTLWALIVPSFAAGSPLFVLLFYWAFRRIPAEIYEAARVDGAGVLAVWWRIARPLTWPTTAGVLVLAFVMYWSDFSSPVLYIYRPDLYTLPVGLQLLKQMDATNWPLLMAGAVVMTLPVVVLFLLVQRFFLRDLTLGR